MDIINLLFQNKDLSNAVIVTALFLVASFNVLTLITIINIDNNLKKLVDKK